MLSWKAAASPAVPMEHAFLWGVGVRSPRGSWKPWVGWDWDAPPSQLCRCPLSWEGAAGNDPPVMLPRNWLVTWHEGHFLNFFFVLWNWKETSQCQYMNQETRRHERTAQQPACSINFSFLLFSPGLSSSICSALSRCCVRDCHVNPSLRYFSDPGLQNEESCWYFWPSRCFPAPAVSPWALEVLTGFTTEAQGSKEVSDSPFFLLEKNLLHNLRNAFW